MRDIHAGVQRTRFPDYGRVLDVKGNTFLSGSREELLANVQAVRKVSEKMYISMQRHGDGVARPTRMFAREEDGGACNAFVPTTWDGDELKIAVNARTFCDAVEQARGKVKVSFTNDMGPLSVTGESDDYIAVMLPYSQPEKR